MGEDANTKSNKVRVVARIRPLAKYEIKNGSKAVVTKVPGYGNGPETLQIDDDSNGAGNNNRWFELDAVLDGSCTQKDVYEKSGASNAIANDLFSGYNATILAYGQTGAGKTFTMGTAPSTDVVGTSEMDGVIPRACQDLFETIQIKCDGQAQVACSYMEVYNEEIRDLLVEKQTEQLRIRETLDGQVYVRGMSERTVTSPRDVYSIMEEANKRRVVASTKMNAESSRSHAICVLKIKGVVTTQDENDDPAVDKGREDGISRKFEAKLTLVDLAGSERLKKTQAKGGRAKEGISINKGLFVLGQVVSALAERGRILQEIEQQKKNGGMPNKRKTLPPRKPPYRDSKLTRLLQDSLGGNSRTIMIACVSPANFNVEETVNTLRYATQARNISNTATANLVETISQDEARKLKRENTLLKGQIADLEATIAKLTQDVTEDDLNRSLSMIQQEQEIHSMGGGDYSGRKRRSLMAAAVAAAADEAVLQFTNSADTDDSNQNAVSNVVDSDSDASDSDSNASEEDDDEVETEDGKSGKLTGETVHRSNVTTTGKSLLKKKPNMSLDDHFSRHSKSSHDSDHDSEEDKDSVSLLVDDVFENRSLASARYRTTRRASSVRGDRSVTSTRTIEELEDENAELEARLLLAERDVRATARDSAVELPALKKRVRQLEDNLNESKWLEDEAWKLKEQLNEARADKESAQRAARQLANFMKQQKQDTGFQGDEFLIQRVNYNRHKLNEDWVRFVVVVLNSFKEEMRLLGDYFHMVVKVVESPDILGMLGMLNNRERETVRNAGVGWWKSKEQKEKEIQALGAEKELRNDLLKGHIHFFNERLVEIEDEVNLRSESIDTILEGLHNERGILESEFESEEEVDSTHDLFSKKGEKLLGQLTELMNGKLYNTAAHNLITTSPDASEVEESESPSESENDPYSEGEVGIENGDPSTEWKDNNKGVGDVQNDNKAQDDHPQEQNVVGRFFNILRKPPGGGVYEESFRRDSESEDEDEVPSGDDSSNSEEEEYEEESGEESSNGRKDVSSKNKNVIGKLFGSLRKKQEEGSVNENGDHEEVGDNEVNSAAEEHELVGNIEIASPS